MTVASFLDIDGWPTSEVFLMWYLAVFKLQKRSACCYVAEYCSITLFAISNVLLKLFS
jgi:hypothetical protein